jgi:hypothetical protein
VYAVGSKTNINPESSHKSQNRSQTITPKPKEALSSQDFQVDTHPHTMSIPVLVTALLALLSLPTDVHVHGYLSSPRSREQNESNSLRGSNAEAAPAEEDEITSSGDIINSPVDPRLATKIFSQSDRGLKQVCSLFIWCHVMTVFGLSQLHLVLYGSIPSPLKTTKDL